MNALRLFFSLAVASSTVLGAPGLELQFLREHPGVKLYEKEGRIKRIYGGSFSTGATALQSADRFRERYSQLLGVEPQDLVATDIQPVLYRSESDDYKFTLIRYRQQAQGIPVFRGELRVLAANRFGNPAVWAGSSLRNVSGLQTGADRIAPRFTPAMEEAERLFPELEVFSTPEIVIWAGVGEMPVEPRVALSFRGAGDRASRLFIADIESGRLIYDEDLIVEVEVAGNVSGLATEGDASDLCGMEVSSPMPYVEVTSGGHTVFSDAAGDYYIPEGGATVEATVDGQWFDIINGAGTEVTVAGPSDSDLLFDAANDDEYIRAQVNVYVQANRARDFAAAYNPAYPTFDDTDIPMHVNDESCGSEAAYNPNDTSSPTGYSVTFCASQTDPFPAANAGYGSVVHHEFAHHLIQAAGSGQGTYGEGMADGYSALINDDPRVGRGLHTFCSESLRSAVNDVQYPCTGSGYLCGQMLSGSIWDSRMKLWFSDPGDYTDILGNLAVNAILLHTGMEVDPGITIDYLTLDDDDADLSNGTPHYLQIAAGFGNHNLAAPQLGSGLVLTPFDDLDAAGPPGGPFSPDCTLYTLKNMEPASISFEVSAEAPWLTISNGSGLLAPGEETTVAVDFNGETIALGGGVYEETVNFINRSNHTGDQTRRVALEVNRTLPYEPTDTPLSLPAISTVSSTIRVTGSVCIGDVDIAVDLDHIQANLLKVSLISPNNDTVVLHELGHWGSGIHGTYDDDGGRLPDGPGELSDFEFDNARGTWTLEMRNDSTWAVGTLNSWSLDFLNLGGLCPPEVGDIDVNLPALLTSGITLTSDNHGGGPVDYLITSLPQYGKLSDPIGGAITSLPYTLLASGDIVNYRPLNGYTGADRFRYRAVGSADSREVLARIAVGIQAPIISFDIESDPGWSTMGGWAHGQPTGGGDRGSDPTSGYTGNNVYGYNLAGDYTDDLAVESLTSSAIDCSDAVQVQASFRRWLGVEGGASDGAAVQVSRDGASWTTVWSNPPASLNEGSWSLQTVDLSPVADRQSEVYLRWTMGPTDGTIVYQGWNIDDVEITGVNAPPIITLSVERDALSWTAMTGAGGYDLLRGDLYLLRSTGGDFTQATTHCVANDESGTSLPYSEDPEPGEAFWFLVRGDSGAAVRTYESFFVPQIGLRDDEISAAAVNCP